MSLKYEMSATEYKRYVVRKAIKDVANTCRGNFEIPMTAISKINFDNKMRKKPVKASYDYVSNMVYEMLRNNEI